MLTMTLKRKQNSWLVSLRSHHSQLFVPLNAALATKTEILVLKKSLALIGLVSIVTGCVSFQPTQLEYVPTNSSLLVIDQRPTEQKETEMLSYLITSCKYGIQRLGDEWTVPNKIEFLKAEISKTLPNARQLKISNFVFYNNMQYQLREGNIYRGPIWSLIECDENTDRFTQYTPEENPERFNILIGTLEGELDGVPFSIRAAEIPVCPESMDKCDGLMARNHAIEKILDQLIYFLVKGG
ncbi:hypothetical protein KJY73_03305 [Bowmanella sp. Y26]|uniref:hypothetical protein n=1 Tax=Bowmanella yangjiangensis TaxID=2811230 RepID=UPI001BDCF964|nr:hypothetical protein [Bowmanella yangjiangensis]MBT1062583.1 hypothetical protein [Bowmanella yangjiangensis]